jgi:hypothetical protein
MISNTIENNQNTPYYSSIYQQQSTISNGYGNKVTGPGVTIGDPEDSSVFNS